MREDTTGCIQTRDPRDQRHGQITSRMGNLMPLSTLKGLGTKPFLKLYTMGDERRVYTMKVVEPVHMKPLVQKERVLDPR